ncbi:uncharacterized protein LOC127154215 isoform X3 [Labeo rohita]|nr:uncharacterized protein LOC127154215 isoform X3 [Labeo rohita]
MHVLYAIMDYETNRVFGDEVKVVPVMEGHSVTLTADGTERQGYDELEWVLAGALIAKINMKNKQISFNENLNKRFRDRLQLNNQTGSLTIINTTITDSGPYHLEMKGTNLKSKIFNVTVYAPVTIPFITSYCPLSSSSSSSGSLLSKCALLCSVVNVSHVSLSWYKGNSLLSSISVSDLISSFSLQMEVEYQDKNTYSCVINNPISHQTTHLDISQHCHTCSDISSSSICYCGTAESVIRLVTSALVGVAAAAAVVVLIYDIRSRKVEQKRKEQKK